MPNYVTNNLYVHGDDETRLAVKKLLEGDNGAVDFNKVLPMPSELDIEAGSVGDRGYSAVRQMMTEFPVGTLANRTMLECACGKKDLTDEEWELGVAYFNNLLNYGAKHWYDWCIENWDTKWNAMDSYASTGDFHFDTAWSTPEKVIIALSAMFPQAEFEVEFFDEDIGHNCGTYTCQNGEVTDMWLPNYDEAICWLEGLGAIGDDYWVEINAE